MLHGAAGSDRKVGSTDIELQEARPHAKRERPRALLENRAWFV